MRHQRRTILYRWRRRLRQRRGYFFVFTMVAMVMLIILGLLSLQVSTNSLLLANRQRRLAEAFNLAETGCDMAAAYLQSLGAPPVSAFHYPPSGGTISLTGGTCSAEVAPETSNPGSWLKTYIITATGTSRNGMSRTVIARARQQSFALYAYFTDYEKSSITNSTIWFYPFDALRGPVHSNDQFHIAWDPNDTTPLFYDTVSTAYATVDYGTYGRPTTAAKWGKIFSGGQLALRTGVDRIELPDSTDGQRNAAWGASGGFPSTNGIYLPTAGSTLCGGIYVRGDCTVQYSVEAVTGNQVITIVQGTTTKTITVDLANNTTKVRVGTGTPTTYFGVPNGVLYTTGNITSLKGYLGDNYVYGNTIVRRNAWTIATDVVGGKSVTITDEVVYNTQPNSNKPMTDTVNLRAPMLGIVALNVTLATSCPYNMTLDAITLAGGRNTTNGTFSYAGWNGSLRGTLTLLGGIIQKKRGPVGTFQQGSYELTSGYNKNYNYDPRVIDSPPPYFPTTGMYDLMTWQYR